MTDDYSANDDLYSPGAVARESETKELDQVMIDAIHNAMLDVHTWQPGQITAVNDDGTVDVQPMLQRTFVDGSVASLPIIKSVLRWRFEGSNYSINPPIAVGDTGAILFCERSLEVWSQQGGVINPKDTRTHHLSDAMFLPGVFAKNKQPAANDGSMIFTVGKAVINMAPSGKFQITNGQQELVNLMVQLIQALQQAMTLTLLGPQPFIASTQLTLTQLLTKLQTLQGP